MFPAISRCRTPFDAFYAAGVVDLPLVGFGEFTFRDIQSESTNDLALSHANGWNRAMLLLSDGNTASIQSGKRWLPNSKRAHSLPNNSVTKQKKIPNPGNVLTLQRQQLLARQPIVPNQP